ncbi:hypothetical protein F5Y17DRAFT_369468 [Xylariaceae sp. FL0594]|nr:hypothetical protein F5Y17DRAFT_369468 [Xylariaceae sp. FL0594]
MASIASLHTPTPSARPYKARKRAPKACLSCRARKVRCDVSQRGRPCMNCYLDSETCIVANRASRFRKGERDGDGNDPTSQPIDARNDCEHGTVVEDIVVDSRVTGGPLPPGPELAHDAHINESLHATEYPAVEQSMPQSGIGVQPSFSGFNVNPKLMFNRPPSPARPFNSNFPSMGIPHLSTFGHPEAHLWSGEQQAPVSADITYSYYPFLSISNLHNVMPQDVNYLESQGCLRIPTRAILDEFVQQYFLHVHPLLPFINEGDFWDLYCNQGGYGSGEKMSLLVFQAMLFSCCNYVSKNSIKALGFSNYRTARATMYRRTKLLFDFDTESSLVCLSQAALLLTYWTPNWSLATKKPSTAWLGVAIQNAKSAEAHMYSSMPAFCPVADPLEHKKQNTLKRLWWCVVIRDRLISLGMRRSIQISRAHFDVDSNSSLGFSDLGDEIERSKVYNPETKRRLIEIHTQLSGLCSVLTDLLTLVFPLNDVPGWGRYNGPEGVEKIKQCKGELRRWYNAAVLRFPLSGEAATRKAAGDKRYHDSVILYTNLMYMFYHSARAALCHHEVLQAAVGSAPPDKTNNNNCGPSIYESRHELKDASCGVTECLNELIQLGLARWLPISASSRTTADEKKQTALKQHRLNILIEAMKTYQPQYDGVDYISETIRHIVNLAQIDTPCNSTNHEPLNNRKPLISDWTDILASHPDSYLRLSMTMDISISKGRLARETDFPVKLRGLFAKGFSPIRALLTGARPRPPDSPSASGSSSSTALQLGSVHSVSSDEGSASPEPVNTNEGLSRTAHVHDTRDDSEQTARPSESELYSVSFLFDDPGSMNCDAMFGGAGDLLLGDDVDYALTADALTAYGMHGEDEASRSRGGGDHVVPMGGQNSDAHHATAHIGEQTDELGLEMGLGTETDWVGDAWLDSGETEMSR